MKAARLALLLLFSSAAAFAQTEQQPAPDAQTPPADQQPAVHPGAIIYSHGYEVRRDIHKYASFATLPLFAAEFALGQSLYNDPTNTGSKKGLHAALGTGLIGVFGLNTVTGVWNLLEVKHQDPNGAGKLRTIHGLLMMASEAGFVATAATGPHGNGRTGALTFNTDRVLHRNIAVASISVGTVGYLLMLLKKH